MGEGERAAALERVNSEPYQGASVRVIHSSGPNRGRPMPSACAAVTVYGYSITTAKARNHFSGHILLCHIPSRTIRLAVA